jgi:hypothetical protein
LVKTYDQYNKIIRILTDWGDDAILAAALPDDQNAAAVRAFCRRNAQGYNYSKHFELEETKAPDGSPKFILLHKNSKGIVCHMLNIFDVISKAHNKQGHMRIEKTLANFKPDFYSPTYPLCKLFIEDCFVCHKKQSEIPARKGARKPIISSKFRDRIQVDLIDI